MTKIKIGGVMRSTGLAKMEVKSGPLWLLQ